MKIIKRSSFLGLSPSSLGTEYSLPAAVLYPAIRVARGLTTNLVRVMGQGLGCSFGSLRVRPFLTPVPTRQAIRIQHSKFINFPEGVFSCP